MAEIVRKDIMLCRERYEAQDLNKCLADVYIEATTKLPEMRADAETCPNSIDSVLKYRLDYHDIKMSEMYNIGFDPK